MGSISTLGLELVDKFDVGRWGGVFILRSETPMSPIFLMSKEFRLAGTYLESWSPSVSDRQIETLKCIRIMILKSE